VGTVDGLVSGGCRTNSTLLSEVSSSLSDGVGRSITDHRSPITDPDEPVYSVFTLRYGKCGDSRYIGHLDTVDLLLRAIRSAGISLKMHGKYHPKPRVSLSPALPVGIESTQEFVQMEVEGIEDIDRSLMTMISSHLPTGMRILGVTKGKMVQTSDGFTYLLVGRKGLDNVGVAIRQMGERAVYRWEGTKIKDLWLSGDFARITKADARRFTSRGERAKNPNN